MLRRRLEPERHGSDGYTTAGRVAAIGLAVSFLLVGLHLGWQAWYNGRMLPGVSVGGRDLSGLTLDQARAVVARAVDGYQLNLDAGGDHYRVSADQLGVTYNIEATVEAAYAVGRTAWLPPLAPTPVPLSYQLNLAKLNSFASGVAGKVGTAPVDAGIMVKDGALTPIPDKNGWTISRVGLEKLVEANVRAGNAGVLTLAPRVQEADIRVANLTPTLVVAEKLAATSITLTYNSQTIQPTAGQVAQWLGFVKQTDGLNYKLVPVVQVASVQSYVQGLAKRLDVTAVSQLVTVINGTTTAQRQGANGTAIDQAPLVQALVAAVTNKTGLTYAITSHMVPFATQSTTLVPLDLSQYIEINLSKQHLWVWQNGQVILDSPVTSGATGAGFPTATGLFHVYNKRTNTHLVGYQYGPRYNYDVFVQYWMAFYQGFGLHDASWRNGNFGETSGPFGYYYDGSHGCVNLPLATAQFLYGWTTIGTPVWVHS